MQEDLKKMLIVICKYGLIDILKTMILNNDLYKIDRIIEYDDKTCNDMLYNAYRNNHTHILDIILSYNISNNSLSSIFELMCNGDDVTNISIILNNNLNRTFDIVDNEILRLLCLNNSLDVFKYLLSIKKYGKFDIHFENDTPFSIVCENGYIDFAKYLLSLEETYGKINITSREIILNSICKNGYLEMLKFLISLEDKYGKFDIHYSGELPFSIAMENNNIDIVKYLISLEKTHGKIDVYMRNFIKFDSLKLSTVKYFMKYLDYEKRVAYCHVSKSVINEMFNEYFDIKK